MNALCLLLLTTWGLLCTMVVLTMALMAGGNEIRGDFESVVIPLSRVKRASKGEGIKEGVTRRLMLDEIHVSVIIGAAATFSV